MTGGPGGGKTTLLRTVACALAGQTLAGFVTEEIPARVVAWLREVGAGRRRDDEERGLDADTDARP